MMILIGLALLALGYLIGRQEASGYQPRPNGRIGSGPLGKPPTGGSAVMRSPNQAGVGQRR